MASTDHSTGECFLTTAQVLERYGFSRDTLRRLLADGEFPPYLAVTGRIHRWRLSDLEAWEAEHTVTPEDQKAHDRLIRSALHGSRRSRRSRRSSKRAT